MPLSTNAWSSSLYSCITQLVRSPRGALPRWKIKVFFIPTVLELWHTDLSFPVVFQYPISVARFALGPFEYFLSRGQKKYHSRSLLFKQDFSAAKMELYFKIHNKRSKNLQLMDKRHNEENIMYYHLLEGCTYQTQYLRQKWTQHANKR